MYAGENIICVGDDQYWGHSPKAEDVRSMQQWFDEIRSWTYTTPPQYTANYYFFQVSWGRRTVNGEPEVSGNVTFPTVGLEK
jgi:hypothetical protein